MTRIAIDPAAELAQRNLTHSGRSAWSRWAFSHPVVSYVSAALPDWTRYTCFLTINMWYHDATAEQRAVVDAMPEDKQCRWAVAIAKLFPLTDVSDATGNFSP